MDQYQYWQEELTGVGWHSFRSFLDISCETNGKIIHLDANDSFRILCKTFNEKKKKIILLL